MPDCFLPISSPCLNIIGRAIARWKALFAARNALLFLVFPHLSPGSYSASSGDAAHQVWAQTAEDHDQGGLWKVEGTI